jgi:hypothetical protein
MAASDLPPSLAPQQPAGGAEQKTKRGRVIWKGWVLAGWNFLTRKNLSPPSPAPKEKPQHRKE